jgi:hypothetical protein
VIGVPGEIVPPDGENAAVYAAETIVVQLPITAAIISSRIIFFIITPCVFIENPPFI